VFWPALLMIRAGALGMAGRGQEGLVLSKKPKPLQDAYDPFTEGFKSPQLVAARAALGR
jgi:hypothetical protein